MDLMHKTEGVSNPSGDLHSHPGRLAPTLDWEGMNPSDHFVQFYESDIALVDAISGFIGAGLDAGENCIVVATQAHRAALEINLQARGLDVAAARQQGQYISLDAAETLSKLMVADSPEPQRFQETVGSVVAQAAQGGRRVRAFGEMVALLWDEGDSASAIRLEELWNDLARSHAFCLFCAYPLQGFGCEAHAMPFSAICTQHSRVLPAESYAALSSPDERLREISLLQQKAKSLEAEIARRKEAEQALQERLNEIEALNARLKRAMTETHHRVKNNLQIISAMIEMQAADHEIEKAVSLEEYARLKSHVCTLAIVHDLLTKGIKESEDAQRVSIKAVLEHLLPMLQQTAWKQTVRFEIDDAELLSKQCISLALILNELVSNALKHGKSAAEVTFRVQGRQAVLEVCDDGPGFPEDFDALAFANTGLELVESLVCTDLAGKACYENRTEGGARVRVLFALPASD